MTSHSDNQRTVENCALPCQLIFAPREQKFWWRQPTTQPTAFPDMLDLGLCTTRHEVRSKAHQMLQHLGTTLLLGAELNLEENYNFATDQVTHAEFLNSIDQQNLIHS